MTKNVDKLIDDTIGLNKTMLGIGPMSKNCVDSSVELSDYFNIPLMLIPSRRQVDSKKIGGGYSNNWSTEEFSKYVKKNLKKIKSYYVEIMEVHGKIIKKYLII